ncbi:hypothetical protein D3C77_462000 [compost metagenome]
MAVERRRQRSAAGQRPACALTLGLPERQFIAQLRAVSQALQVLGPALIGAGACRQCNGLASVQLPVNALQVFKQDAPGHAVHHQVVNGQEQSLTAIGQGRQQAAQQRPLGQVEAALELIAHAGQPGAVLHPGLNQQAGQRRLAIVRRPALG